MVAVLEALFTIFGGKYFQKRVISLLKLRHFVSQVAIIKKNEDGKMFLETEIPALV